MKDGMKKKGECSMKHERMEKKEEMKKMDTKKPMKKGK